MTKYKRRITRNVVRDYLRKGNTKRFKVSGHREFLDTLCRRTGTCLGPVKPEWLKVLLACVPDAPCKFTSKDLLSWYYQESGCLTGNWSGL